MMALGKDRATLKIATVNGILVATAFVWYLIAYDALKVLLPDTSESVNLMIFGVNALAIAICGLLGTIFVDRVKNRRLFLYLWIAGGIPLSLIPFGLSNTSITDIGIISILFGAYFGLGMPTAMGYHSSFTKVEGRAKIGGLTFLIIASTFAITNIVALESLPEMCLILAATKIIGLLFFHFMPIKEEPHREEVKVKFTKIISNKTFLLYFIPWGMFALINFATLPIERSMYPTEYYTSLVVLENIVTALVAVITGFVADKWGRKRLIIIGFVMLGIGYATIGLTSSWNLLFGSIVYTFTDGVAWGIFYVLFLFTLWGDLAQNGKSDKFYFLGALPYVSSFFIQLLFTPSLDKIDVQYVFSFASLFLFVAVLPLIYAPETLPEKVMKDRDLKSYLEKAQKIAKKESDQNRKENKKDEEKEQPEQEENSKEYDEALKLAEKYY